MEERRKAHRDRTCLCGQAAFNDQRSTADCLVRNLSRGGAKIAFSGPMTAPNEFDFTIFQKGDSRRARIVWRRETEAGVLFLPSDDGSVVSLATAQKIRRLQSERDALARRVAQLSKPTC
jgi:hypothetical protein